MPQDQPKAFLDAVNADTLLQERLKTAAGLDAVVEIASEAGFVMTTDCVQKAQIELFDEDLAGVSGGSQSGSWWVDSGLDDRARSHEADGRHAGLL